MPAQGHISSRAGPGTGEVPLTFVLAAATLMENRKLRASLHAKSLELKRRKDSEGTIKSLQAQLADSTDIIRQASLPDTPPTAPYSHQSVPSFDVRLIRPYFRPRSDLELQGHALAQRNRKLDFELQQLGAGSLAAQSQLSSTIEVSLEAHNGCSRGRGVAAKTFPLLVPTPRRHGSRASRCAPLIAPRRRHRLCSEPRMSCD